jgi:hypothetical protein
LWKMYLRLDPWATEYNTAYHAESIPEDARGGVVTDVEQPGPWEAIDPRPCDDPWRDLLFIDGSRRIEARVLLEDERNQLAFGALGTIGVGAVSCCAQGSRTAQVLQETERLVIRRVCALSAGHSLAQFVVAAAVASQLGALSYQVEATEERDVDAVVRKLQNVMRDAEKSLASRLVDQYPQALIICDGPRPYLGSEANVIGYVKTIHEPRVGQQELELVRRLEQGQRSPLYLVKGNRPEQSYFEWFFRLRDPNPCFTPWRAWCACRRTRVRNPIHAWLRFRN